MSDDFRQRVRLFSERMISVAPRCTNEEGTKLFLVLPFFSLLGYDITNPDEVCPEHNADFSEKYKNRVDFAILKNGAPIIAIECKTLGMALRDERGQLRSYFNAAPTVKMGVITDGLVYEFYADSDEPNMMDQAAFFAFDLREAAKGKLEDSIEDGLRSLQKTIFDPENIGAEAKRKLVFQNFVIQINELSQEPSETFTRLLLQNVGLSHVRAKSLPEYQELIRRAFREFINQRIFQRLDLPEKEKELEKVVVMVPDSLSTAGMAKTEEAIVTTERELKVFDYTKRRLAFLVKDDALFEQIEKIDHRDYKGKFVIFYRKERAGRLFEFYDGSSPGFRFDFGQAGGEVVTEKLSDIDSLLLNVFRKRVEEMGAPAKRREA